jgi:polar amino acid transport system substrate-binding protein
MTRTWLAGAAFAWALGLTASTHAQAPNDASVPRDAGAPSVAGEPTAAAQPTRPLRVVVSGSAPFVVEDDDKGFTGLSIDVWQRVASNLDLVVRLQAAASVDDGLARIERGEADVLVGPVSIGASRAERVAFTQPYYYSSLAIAAPASSTLLDRMRPFLTVAFMSGCIFFFTTLLLVGTLIWLAERAPDSPHFPMDVLRGIGNGIWLALVTMTTVGFGDLVPRTVRGRVVAGVWMLGSMLMASSLTAFIATALTLSQMDQPALADARQLSKHRVAVVEGTLSERFARTHKARIVQAPDLEAALALVGRGKADAVVFDEPALRYALAHEPDLDLSISAGTYWPRGYGFALPLDSTLRDRITVELLRLEESGDLETIAKRWL